MKKIIILVSIFILCFWGSIQFAYSKSSSVNKYGKYFLIKDNDLIKNVIVVQYLKVFDRNTKKTKIVPRVKFFSLKQPNKLVKIPIHKISTPNTVTTTIMVIDKKNVSTFWFIEKQNKLKRVKVPSPTPIASIEKKEPIKPLEEVKPSPTTAEKNKPPQFDPINDVSVYVDEKIVLVINAKDEDGDPLEYFVISKPSGAFFDPLTKTFTWTPDRSGQFFVVFLVTDGKAKVEKTVKIEVKSPITYGGGGALPTPVGEEKETEKSQPTNRPPVAKNLNFTVDSLSPIVINLKGLDEDGDPLTYTIVDKPRYGIIWSTPPTIVYIPNELASNIIEDKFTYRVSDGKETSNLASVIIQILPFEELTQ